MLGIGKVIGGLFGVKMRWIVTAGVIVMAGMGWRGIRDYSRPDQGITPASQVSSIALNANWQSDPGVGQEMISNGDWWSQKMIQMGISFIVAMVAAAILRTAFKTGVALITVVGAVVWWLDYQGYVHVWSQFNQTVKDGSLQAMTQIQAVGLLLKEHLPSTGASVIGFALGLRR